MFEDMNDLVSLSNSLADVVARTEAGIALVHGARCETASGVAWTKDLLVTAAHAIDRERGIEITLASGRHEATLVGADNSSNLAVLRIQSELSPLPQADVGRLRTGELALAVSRGTRGLKARLGVVGRLGGEWRLPGGLRVERYVESDIAPAPGLSGSALVSAGGELIGVNLAGLVRGSLVTLPAPAVQSIVDAIARHGRVRRARLGVALERVELPRSVADRHGQRHGLLVLSVLEGGPGERAGILQGDVIVALAGNSVERVEDLQTALGEAAIDVPAEVTLVRAGNELTLSATPEAR